MLMFDDEMNESSEYELTKIIIKSKHENIIFLQIKSISFDFF